MTFREYELLRDGYMRKLDVKRELNLEGWRQARLIAYHAVIPHVKNQNLSIQDFMPIPGDNTNRSEDEAMAVIEYYKQQGWLKEGKA